MDRLFEAFDAFDRLEQLIREKRASIVRLIYFRLPHPRFPQRIEKRRREV